MLIIRKNLVNNLIATVSMNKTLPNPYYLFSFQHIASKERISFIPEKVISNVRYDKFSFVENPTTNLSAFPPLVNFNYLGQYYYSIYEQLSPTNTNIDLTYNKLESGRAWVIVGDDNTEECFFEPYISNDEDFAQVIYVSEEEQNCQNPIQPTPTATTPIQPTPSPTATIGTTPTPTPTVGTSCPTFICQASPQKIYDYNTQTNTLTSLFTYSGCAAFDMALTDTQMFYYDGCQHLWVYDYTYNNGNFTKTFVKEYNPLSPYAWGAGLAAKDNRTLISSSGYSLSNTVNDYTTIFEYDIITSGYTALFQLPYHYIVAGDILYSPQSGQYVISVVENNASTSAVYCYDRNGNLLNAIYTPNWLLWGLYWDNGRNKMYGFNQSGIRVELDWNAQRFTFVSPIQQDYLYGAGQKWSCQNFTIPTIYPITPTITPTMTPTPSTTPPPAGLLTFLVASGDTQGQACSNLTTGTTFNVYAQDLGFCGPCLPFNCWPCLRTSQQVYMNPSLTIPVPDGYYANNIGTGNGNTWYIVGGFPQGGGFMSC